MDNNLPPGVSLSSIPGNTDEDFAWDSLFESITRDADTNNMTDMDVLMAWEMGLSAFIKAKSFGARFPHSVEEKPK